MKIFKNLYKLVVRRLQVQKVHPAYELTQLYLLDGPLKYFEWSAAIKTLCNYITDHLELLLENTFSTQIPMKCGRRNMIRVLNYFLECVKLWKILFRLNIHTPASNASTTTINTVHVLYFPHLRHAYHYMHTCILLNYYLIPYSVHTIKLLFDSVLCTFDTSDMK